MRDWKLSQGRSTAAAGGGEMRVDECTGCGEAPTFEHGGEASRPVKARHLEPNREGDPTGGEGEGTLRGRGAGPRPHIASVFGVLLGVVPVEVSLVVDDVLNNHLHCIVLELLLPPLLLCLHLFGRWLLHGGAKVAAGDVVGVKLLDFGLQVGAERDEGTLVGLGPAVAGGGEDGDEATAVQHLRRQWWRGGAVSGGEGGVRACASGRLRRAPRNPPAHIRASVRQVQCRCSGKNRW